MGPVHLRGDGRQQRGHAADIGSFGFGRALDAELLKNFGVTLEAVEARELIEKAKGFTDEECEADLEEAKKWMAGIENTPDKNVKDFARL